MNSLKRWFRSVAIAITLLFLSLQTPGLVRATQRNVQLIQLNKLWSETRLAPDLPKSSFLKDDIPDGWTLQYRQQGRGFITRESSAASKPIVVLTHRSGPSGLALFQTVPLDGAVGLTLRAAVKGSRSAIRLQVMSDGAWMDVTQLAVDNAETWQTVETAVSLPNPAAEARLFITTSDQLWLEWLFLGESDDPTTNLLQNGELTLDGSPQPPLTWWENSVDLAEPSAAQQNALAELESAVSQNIRDVIGRRYSEITGRSDILPRCTEGDTVWLTHFATEFEASGGTQAAEQLNRLATELMPRCPGPHANLAQLYEAAASYKKAADHYIIAAEFLHDDPLAGAYHFEAGFLLWSKVGDPERAVMLLQKASGYDGWHSAEREPGIETYYLGRIYQERGAAALAKQKYQDVLDCPTCAAFHQSAQTFLVELEQ